MKSATPASYTKIFSITPSSSVVAAHRGLLIVSTGASVGTLVVTLQDGTSTTINNIPGSTIFILPLIARTVTTATNISVYGLF